MKNTNAAWIALVAMALLLAGCKTVSFNTLRPAKVNVPGIAPEGTDPTVSIGSWTGVDESAAREIAQSIREHITNSPGGIVKFAESGGVVLLDGELAEHSHSESRTKEQRSCSRYNNQTKKSESYPCTVYGIKGTAKIRVSMNVIDREGKTVGADTFSDSVDESRSATDSEPPPIDWAPILSGLRESAARELSKLVVPYPIVVTKKWYSCGDADDLCKGGFTQMNAGNMSMAKEMFSDAVEKLKAMPDPNSDDLAAAWWALTLSQEFSGEYAAARVSLQEAIRLDPENEAFAQEMTAIKEEEQAASGLAKQGIGGEE